MASLTVPNLLYYGWILCGQKMFASSPTEMTRWSIAGDRTNHKGVWALKDQRYILSKS